MSDDYQTPLSPGDRLDRYELICPIASGGMASVWVGRLRGKHGFEKLVAIKTILPQYASDTRFRAMFLDEASLLSQIQHANVAQVLDMGEERSVLYLVMEFVDGDSVSKLMKTIWTSGMPVPLGVIMRVLADASVGLHAAHELRDKSTGALVGLVHRDVSPQNILITQQGATKVIDFGIAKAKGRLTQDTNAGAIKGKIGYMPPEQAQGKQVDRRADVWSMGAMLYAFFTQRTPFEGETELDTLHALVVGKDPAPLGAEVPQIVREIVARATRAAPEERFATALDLSRALEGAMSQLGLLTSQSDVAIFMGTHLKDRAEGRKKALAFALKAAADRERVRELLSPDNEDSSSTSGLDGTHRRMVAANLDDSIPPPALTGDAARVRVPGTRAYDESGLGHEQTAYESGAPEGMMRPVIPTKIGEPFPYPAPVAAQQQQQQQQQEEVPDLLVPSGPPRKAPPPPRPPPAMPTFSASPLDLDDDSEGFVVPPPQIASAAGSLLGPDVLGPNAGKIQAQAPVVAARTTDELPSSSDFFDPMAIAAKRAAEPSVRPASRASNGPYEPPGEMLGASRPARAIVVDTQGDLRRAREERQGAARAKWKVPTAITVVAVLVLAGVGIVTAPGYARRQAIAAAAAQGVTLTVERATVGWGTVHLYGLAFSGAEFPSTTMTAPEMILDLKGLDADAIVIQDPSITAAGSGEDVEASAAKLSARASAGTGKARRVAFQNGRITWTGPLGDGSRLDAESVGLELVRGAGGLGDETHLTCPQARITTARGVLGPWRVDADRSPKQSRLRVGFDPVLADGPSAIVVRGDGGTSATLKITRQPLSRLGIPAAFLGLVPDDQTQVEAGVQVTKPLPNRMVGDAALTLFDARLTPTAPKMDVSLKGGFAGEPGRPLETSRTQLSFGPLIANVIGAVTLLDESFRVDLKWAVPPLPCGVLLKKTSPVQASAAGLVVFDSRRPDKAEFKLTQASTCGLAIFPSL